MEGTILAAAKRALEQYRMQEDRADLHTVVFPPAALPELHRAVAFATRSSSRQILPFTGGRWRSSHFEDTVWRDRALSGIDVQRVYVLPHKVNENDSFAKQLAADKEAGIRSSGLVLSTLPQEDGLTAVAGLLILDDSVAVIAKGDSQTEGASLSWTVTDNAADLRYASSTWEHVRELVERRVPASPGSVDLEEPLALSADIICEVAGVLCTSDQVDKVGCAWYHSAWQYLRLLNLVSTPTWHAEFYRGELAKALSSGSNPKALVTGCADYSMLAFLKAGSDATGRPASLSVLDHCPTPLFACKWYAHHLRFAIRTFETDLFAAPGLAEQEFDLVCSDALLTRFSPQETSKVLSIWTRLLRPGGRVVTTVRLHPSSPAAREPEAAIIEFRRAAEQRALRWQSFLRRSPTEIGELAETYARRMQSENLGTEDDIRKVFEGGGYRIERADLVPVPGELRRTRYLEITAIAGG